MASSGKSEVYSHHAGLSFECPPRPALLGFGGFDLEDPNPYAALNQELFGTNGLEVLQNLSFLASPTEINSRFQRATAPCTNSDSEALGHTLDNLVAATHALPSNLINVSVSLSRFSVIY